MKKLLLPLLLIILVSMLAAVESEPSEVVGYVKYECAFNLNGSNTLIALPMGTQYTMASELGDAYPGLISAITGFNPDSQTWSGASYGAGTWFGDFPVYPGFAYMITATEEFTMFSLGELNDPVNYELVTNANGSNNLIMVPLNRSDLLTAAALGGDIAVANAVTQWDSAGQVWTGASYGSGTWFGDFNIAIGQPLMVTVTSGTNWGGLPPARSMTPAIESRSKK